MTPPEGRGFGPSEVLALVGVLAVSALVGLLMVSILLHEVVSDAAGEGCAAVDASAPRAGAL